MDTLAVQLTVPVVGSVGDLPPQVSAPARRTNEKALLGPPHARPTQVILLQISGLMLL